MWWYLVNASCIATDMLLTCTVSPLERIKAFYLPLDVLTWLSFVILGETLIDIVKEIGVMGHP